MGDSLVSWLSKKQGLISLSTTEVEYIAAATCCTQILWMIKTLEDLEVKYVDPIHLHCDNTSAISMSKNLVLHSNTKHIPITYHLLREQVTNRVVQFLPHNILLISLKLYRRHSLSTYARSWVSYLIPNDLFTLIGGATL